MKNKNKLFLTMVFSFIFLLGCKQPKLITLTKDKLNKHDCEVIFYTDKKFKNINEFEKEIYTSRFKKKYYSTCKCDTIYVDLNDLFDLRKKDSSIYWGTCKTRENQSISKTDSLSNSKQ